MLNPITILGGNIVGLAAAWYLAKKGCPVTIYESKIWDKPCGGAITIEFAQYLRQELDIDIKALDQFIPRIKFAFLNSRHVETKGIFVITSRQDIQNQLIKRLQKEPNINIVFKQFSTKDHHLFTPQTILATGFSGFTTQILKDRWQHIEYAATLKSIGTIKGLSGSGTHLIMFDSKKNGYGWVFIQPDNKVNIGVGGLTKTHLLYQWYDEFIELIRADFNYHFTPDQRRPKLWKIPIAVNNLNTPVAFSQNNIEFIGAGDVLGLAHPFLAAGIEPAWQSGWLLGESVDPNTKKINTIRYRHLLKQNLLLTSRKRFDIILARLLRYNFIPYKNQLSFNILSLLKNPIIRNIKKYPWFAMVHDGDKKTGFKISP